MNKIKDIIYKAGIFITILLILCYVLFLTVIPKVFSSEAFLNTVHGFITKKTGIVITSERLNVKTRPSLLIDISVEKLNLMSGSNELLNVKNALLTYDIKRFKPIKAELDYIYLNQQHLKNAGNSGIQKKNSEFKPDKLPEITVKKAEIYANKDEINSILINITNLNIKNSIYGKTKCSF